MWHIFRSLYLTAKIIHRISMGMLIMSFAVSPLMVYACPAESDPRDKLEDFVKNPNFRIIAGLRTDGMGKLIEMVTDEIRRQEPESRIISLDRELLSDNGIDMPRDLEGYLERTAESGRCNFLLCDDLPVVGWQNAVKCLVGRDAQVYCFSVACRQIPSCSKLI